MNSIFSIPMPKNEPIFDYAKGSEERELLIEALKTVKDREIDIPLIIGGREVRTGRTEKVIIPHDHKHNLGYYHKATEKEIKTAINEAIEAKKLWYCYNWQDRSAIFLKAAELLSTRYRYLMNAATMLNQSKTAHQSEIDAVAELIDFFRFNVYYMQEIYKCQPIANPKGEWNITDYRSLEGFVFAITPFNFTSIAGNLPSAPAIMGNTVLWKPSSASVLSGYYIMKLLKEAGLPDGVINFIPGSGREIGNIVLKDSRLAGVHFTGSTQVFNTIWRTIGVNIENYKSYPKIVGETGGKDFIFVHNSVINTKEVAVAAVRGAFEYQGQKCSAASRMYIPQSIHDEIQGQMTGILKEIKTGSTENFENFMGAVIDEKSFDDTMEYIQKARESNKAEVIYGGNGDKSVGYFIEPTVILAKDPHFITMEEELFAPVLTIFVYDDDKFEETLKLCDETSIYGLTGAIFAGNRCAIKKAKEILKNSAGNFYINDKPTGAVVGQQPFGGSRRSGTNDKAGSYLNLLRWTSPQTIKEAFVPPLGYRYKYMD